MTPLGKDTVINIIGAGVVGIATQRFLDHLNFSSVLVDTNIDRLAELRNQGSIVSPQPTHDAAQLLAFICVPTPFNELEGKHDLAYVRAAICSTIINQSSKNVTLVLRSTVTLGTCSILMREINRNSIHRRTRINLVYMPEFVRQATAEQDAVNPRRIILGGTNGSAINCLKKMFERYDHIICTFTDFHTAEMIKMAHNAWNAVKISYWNELYRIGQTQSIDMIKVAQEVAITSEASWNPNYGIKGGFPFGGACLPKDLCAFIGYSKSLGIEPKILSAAHEINNIERKLKTSFDE